MVGGMIEVLSHARCTSCNICVRICPTNVFDEGDAGEPPTLTRHDDCQTCFQCEAYCPEDAIYVAPLRQRAPEGSEWRDEALLIQQGQLGLYRQRAGLNPNAPVQTASDGDFFGIMASLPRRAP
jgi:NAD-dependent dihydropyrimidine dehydrogenase PreA subunit